MPKIKSPSGCLKGFSKCLKATSEMCITGDEIIEIIELATSNPVEKAIMNSIQAIMKISVKALVALSNSCANRALEIDVEHQKKLIELGLLNKDASVSSAVANVVKQVVTISPK